MGMQGEEITKLPVNNPADGAIRVFAFNLKDSFLAI
jgi:hypothetical protein